MKSLNWMGSIVTDAPPDTAATPWRVRLADTVVDWLDRSRQRATLARLDDRMLADIGCDHATAAAEADKPFWRK